MIEVSEIVVDKVYARLAGLNEGLAPTTALKNAIERSMITARSETAKAVSKTYNISQRDLKEFARIDIFKRNQSVIEAGFSYAGSVIPLIKFQVSPPKPVSGRIRKYTKVSVMKANGATTLVSAYVANLGLHGVGVFERETSRRESSKQLYGPSAAHMAGNEEIQAHAMRKAQETFDKRIDHEVWRILNGYRG